MFAAAAMSLSSFCVVSNALRLNVIDIKSTNGKYTAVRRILQVQKSQKIKFFNPGFAAAPVAESRETVFLQIFQ